jgi:5-methylcytosine-specific restriction endonuclease McrA
MEESIKKNERGWNFEIDRKKPNLEYTTENCVAACYWCNNAKTDEFDDVEFKPIGELIGDTLKARFNK